MLSREESARPDWIQLEERVIREEENKTVSLLNISKEGRNSQLGRVSATAAPFITSQVVPLYQSSNHNGPASQRHSHLYRLKQTLPTHTHATSEVVSRFQPPLPPLPEQMQRVVCVAPSFIDQTRPLRSIFPSSSYATTTQVDENLIVVADEVF
jgi:hypothetical protein